MSMFILDMNSAADIAVHCGFNGNISSSLGTRFDQHDLAFSHDQVQLELQLQMAL